MKRTNLKKWIGMLMVLFSLLTGMCLETFETDLFFSSVRTGKTTCVLTVPEQTLIYQDQCREEQLGVRNVTGSIEQIGRITTKNGMRERILSLSPENLPEKSIFLFGMQTAEEYCQNTWSGAVIMNYIHAQDGEKA